MAISPGIPTSFVPRQPVSPTPTRPQRAGRDYFFLGSLALAGIAVLIAAGTFLYDRVLQHSLATKSAAVAEATKNIDENTVQNFKNLRNRLADGKDLIANHVMLSQFFDDLEQLTLQNVRYTSLAITIAGDHSAKVTISGIAKNFNTLAAESAKLAGDTRIKRAIFSNINVDSNNLVTYTLTADLDPSLIVAGTAAAAASQPAALVPAIPAATTTAGQANGVMQGAATSSAATTTTP